ncbi:Hypothetical protein IALB_3121 [Ignavibacterium album JCM 16511]|uniref:Uncharacterized protein n=1 Tax=Ignavibacterium album (strain DSM 19864 / JCM 16511 / NBRC 101810 / Mat9-16) TaxID=945713 RepID=I0APB7_IGNAJ|nr:hypothetical protein [Ignavibacterium album]AFH50824.1 Hypothetical protein IALB_3121 [Ignavibacterium album JCM 16511]
MNMEKLSIYDFIAVLIPGIFFLIITEMIFNLASSEFYIPEGGNFSLLLILTVLGYITGILLQGLSQSVTEKILRLIWRGQLSEKCLMDNDTFLTNDYKKILWEKVKQRLNREKPANGDSNIRKNNSEIFSIIVKLVERERTNEKNQIFMAQYSFYRSLITVFVIFIMFSLFNLLITRDISRIEIIILIFSFIGLLISYSGVKRRNEDFVRATLDAFVVL